MFRYPLTMMNSFPARSSGNNWSPAVSEQPWPGSVIESSFVDMAMGLFETTVVPPGFKDPTLLVEIHTKVSPRMSPMVKGPALPSSAFLGLMVMIVLSSVATMIKSVV